MATTSQPPVGHGQPNTPLAKPRGKRRGIDPNETPDRRFRRLANMRVGKALNLLRRISLLANKRQYLYTQEQAKKITDALGVAVRKINDAFAGVQQQEQKFEV